MATQAAEYYGVPVDLFHALIQQESNWNPKAVSKAGAIGLGQLMPATAKDLGVPNIQDPAWNIDGAARYLKQQLDRFGTPELALSAYNAGPGNVTKAGGIPNIPETKSYVSKIMNAIIPKAEAATAMAAGDEFAYNPDTYEVWKRINGKWVSQGIQPPKDKVVSGFDVPKDFNPDKPLIQRISEIASMPLNEIAGGVIGGGLGALSPIPGGAAIGAALGTATGHGLGSAYEALRGRESRPAERVAMDAATQGLAQPMLGRAAEWLLSKAPLQAMFGTAKPEAAQVAADYAKANVPLTMGAVGSRGPQLFQEAVANMPGGAGVMAKTADDTANAMQAFGKAAGAKGYATAMPESAFVAGQAIQKGAGNFLEKFDKTAAKYYGAVRNMVPMTEAQAVTPASQQTLGKLVAPIPKWISDKIESPANLDELWRVRQAIGDRLATSDLRGVDLSKRELKALYGSLTDDIRTSIAPYGAPAVKAFDTANTFFRRSIDKINTDVNRVLKTLGDKPDQVFNSMINGGESAILRTRTMVDPKNWDIVQAESIRRMGLATPGQQNAAGDLFSPNTFLTNYSKLSDRSKNLLFGGGGKYRDMKSELDTLARISGSVRSIKSVSNPSGTARIENVMDAIKKFSSIPVAGLSGAYGYAQSGGDPLTTGLYALAPIGGAYSIAKLFTWPWFLKTLTDVSKSSATGDFMKNLSAKLLNAHAEDAENSATANAFGAFLGLEGLTTNPANTQ